MYSLIAALPILLCVILMVAFGWPAKRAMPLAYLAAASEAGFLWKMQGVRIAGGTVLGFLSALEILRKYDLHTESIYLGKTGGVTMYLDQVKVQLGRTDFELKISKIAQIYPYLEGRSGTINMTNYSSSDENIILK